MAGYLMTSRLSKGKHSIAPPIMENQMENMQMKRNLGLSRGIEGFGVLFCPQPIDSRQLPQVHLR